MQYVIKCGNYYFQKDHSKVIVFDDEREAYSFKDAFYNMCPQLAAPTMMMSFGNSNIMQEIEDCKNITKVIPLPDVFDRPTINYNTMK